MNAEPKHQTIKNNGTKNLNGPNNGIDIYSRWNQVLEQLKKLLTCPDNISEMAGGYNLKFQAFDDKHICLDSWVIPKLASLFVSAFSPTSIPDSRILPDSSCSLSIRPI